jgi:hypothetical protein
MTLAELIQEVYTLTNRPDRVAETASAIRSATLKAHQSDYYYKDIFETGINFGAVNYLNDLDYRSIIPLFRAIKYLRKYSLGSDGTFSPGKELELLQPNEVFDIYKCAKNDIYYAAGSQIHIKSSTQDQYYLFGCYLNPNITDTGFNSWVALDHPYVIIFDAAATVFKSIGKDEEASGYRQLVAEQLSMLKSSNITAAGY